jgi:DNA-binding transcriptional LysR family regulator
VTIELRNLRWAIVAAQHRSLRQAAEALNIRQSTLSRGHGKVEGAFLMKLLTRGPSRYRLGRYLIQKLTAFLSDNLTPSSIE